MVDPTDVAAGIEKLLNPLNPLKPGNPLSPTDALSSAHSTVTQTAGNLAQSANPLTQTAGNLAQGANPLTQTVGNLAQGANPLTQTAGNVAQGANPFAQGGMNTQALASNPAGSAGSSAGSAGSSAGSAGSSAGGAGSSAGSAGSSAGSAGSSAGSAGSSAGSAGSSAGSAGSSAGGAGSSAGSAGSSAGGAGSSAGSAGSSAGSAGSSAGSAGSSAGGAGSSAGSAGSSAGGAGSSAGGAGSSAGGAGSSAGGAGSSAGGAGSSAGGAGSSAGGAGSSAGGAGSSAGGAGSSAGGAGSSAGSAGSSAGGAGSSAGGAGSSAGGAGSSAGGAGSSAGGAGSSAGSAGSSAGGAGSSAGSAGSSAGGAGSSAGSAGSSAGSAGSSAGGAGSSAGGARSVRSVGSSASGATGAVNQAAAGATGAVTQATNSATGAVSSATGAATGAVSSATGAATGAVSSATGAATSAVSSATGAATSAVSSATGAATSAVSSATGAATGAVSSATGAATSAVSSATGAATSAVSGATGAATSAVSGATGAATSAVSTAGGLGAGATGVIAGSVVGGVVLAGVGVAGAAIAAAAPSSKGGAVASHRTASTSAGAASGSTPAASTPASTSAGAASGSTPAASTPASTSAGAASGSTPASSTPASTSAGAASGSTPASSTPASASAGNAATSAAVIATGAVAGGVGVASVAAGVGIAAASQAGAVAEGAAKIKKYRVAPNSERREAWLAQLRAETDAAINGPVQATPPPVVAQQETPVAAAPAESKKPKKYRVAPNSERREAWLAQLRAETEAAINGPPVFVQAAPPPVVAALQQQAPAVVTAADSPPPAEKAKKKRVTTTSERHATWAAGAAATTTAEARSPITEDESETDPVQQEETLREATPVLPGPPKLTAYFPALHDSAYLEVAEFRETAQLSQLTELKVTLVTRDDVTEWTDALLGNIIEIRLETEHTDLVMSRAAEVSEIESPTTDPKKIPGIRSIFGTIVSVIEEEGPNGEEIYFHVVVRPRAWILTQKSGMRLCVDKSIPDIIEAVLRDSDLLPGKDFELRLTKTYEKRSFVIQYKETDFDFISRLTEFWGISYFFEHFDGRDTMIFTDGDVRWTPAAVPLLPFVPNGEALGLTDMQMIRNRVPGTYILRDYNPNHPDVDWSRAGAVKGGEATEVIEYCPNFETMEEGALLLSARLDALTAQRVTFSGTVQEATLEVGTVATVAGHPVHDKRKLSITGVANYFRSAVFGGNRPAEFTSKFTAALNGTNVRPERRTPKPQIDGILAGVIEVTEDKSQQYAEVDEDGCYRVRLLIDDPVSNPMPYAKVRMIQPHGGQGFGIHFPLRPGTEVAVTFIGGDPDRPVVTGSLTNAKINSPVEEDNSKVNIIRTGGGNQIELDDTQGLERIKLSTPCGASIVQLGSPYFPNAGITVDTRQSISERAAVGVTLMAPFADQATMISQSLSRIQVLESGADEFKMELKAALDTPLAVQQAMGSIAGMARSVADVYQNLKGKGKVKSEKLQDDLNDIEDKYKKAQRLLEKFRRVRNVLFFEAKNKPEAIVTKRQKSLYNAYTDAVSKYEASVTAVASAETEHQAEKEYKEAKENFTDLKSAREELLKVLDDKLAFTEVVAALKKEEEIPDPDGNVLETHELELAMQMARKSSEKHILDLDYEQATKNVKKLEDASEKCTKGTGAFNSIGQVLTTLLQVEGLFTQASANQEWNVAPGNLYAPGLATSNPETFLSSESIKVIKNDFKGRNFVRGWTTCQTQVLSDHALTLVSKQRLVQSGKAIAINAWANEPDFDDPAASKYEKWKNEYLEKNKIAKGLGAVAQAANFGASFIASPLVQSIKAYTTFGGDKTEMQPDEDVSALASSDSPGSPAGLLLLRSEVRTLVTSDNLLEIGAPTLKERSKNHTVYGSEKINVMVGAQDVADPTPDEHATGLLLLDTTGKAELWADNEIHITHSADKRKDGKPKVDLLLNKDGAVLDSPDGTSITLKVVNSTVVIDKSTTTVDASDQGTITLKAGQSQIEIKSDGITIKGSKITVESSGGVSMSSNGSFEVSSKGSVDLSSKGSFSASSMTSISVTGKTTAEFSGTAKTTVGGSGPTQVQGAAVMLG